MRKKLDQVLSTLRDLLLKKHHDYGDENLKFFGEFGILVRVFDKVGRLKRLSDVGNPANETIEDTWMDIAGYGILALILRTK